MVTLRRLTPTALALLVAACQQAPTRDELEAARNTIDCDVGGERVIVRFDEGEARMLMPDATRVVLYQVPAASGLRYTNGYMELRGRGLDYVLTRERSTMKMTCKPYEIPKKE